MVYREALILMFKEILFACYFISFLILYFFGWYNDKRLRMVAKTIRLHSFARIFFHFRGAKQSKSDSHSAICVYFELAALVLFFILNPASFLTAKLIQDIIIIDRIALGVMAASAVSVIAAFIIANSVFKEKMRIRGKNTKKKKTKFRDLEDANAALEKIKETTAEEKPAQEQVQAQQPVQEAVQVSANADFEEFKSNVGKSTRHSYYRPIRKEDDKLESFSSAKSNAESSPAVKSSGRSYYRPIKKEDDKLESFSSAKNNMSASPSDGDPVGENTNSIQSAIKQFKQKNPLDDEHIVITRYSQISEKYRDVKIESSFADADSLRSAQEKMKKKNEVSSDPLGFGADASEKPSDLEMLNKFKKDELTDAQDVGSLKDMIEKNKKKV